MNEEEFKKDFLEEINAARVASGLGITAEFVQKIQEIFDINLRIPEYQRPYKWQVNHAQQLIIDLLKHFKQNIIYRIGTIVLYHHSNKMHKEVHNNTSCHVLSI